MTPIDPRLDLALRRVIRAPRHTIWTAWTDPSLLERWWVPSPAVARVERLDVHPGGAFVTSMSRDKCSFVPHTDAVFLAVDPEHRLVFTNAVDGTWRPATPEPVTMTAEIALDDHPDGTDYRILVRHGDPSTRDHHERLGFLEGWGSVTEALARICENGDPT